MAATASRRRARRACSGSTTIKPSTTRPSANVRPSQPPRACRLALRARVQRPLPWATGGLATTCTMSASGMSTSSHCDAPEPPYRRSDRSVQTPQRSAEAPRRNRPRSSVVRRRHMKVSITRSPSASGTVSAVARRRRRMASALSTGSNSGLRDLRPSARASESTTTSTATM